MNLHKSAETIRGNTVITDSDYVHRFRTINNTFLVHGSQIKKVRHWFKLDFLLSKNEMDNSDATRKKDTKCNKQSCFKIKVSMYQFCKFH